MRCRDTIFLAAGIAERDDCAALAYEMVGRGREENWDPRGHDALRTGRRKPKFFARILGSVIIFLCTFYP